MCDERERLIGYVYDECDPEERRTIASHLETCNTCRTEIAGLRQVRQDLLAWGVPEHDSVWRPFAPLPVAPWWRQVPVWALATAAGVMLMVGAAGGVVTHALVGHPEDVQTAVVPVQAPVMRTSMEAVITPAELTAAEARILDRLRAELGPQIRRAQVHPEAGVSVEDLEQTRQVLLETLQDIEEQQARIHRQQVDIATSVNSDFGNIQMRLRSLDDRVLRIEHAGDVPGGR